MVERCPRQDHGVVVGPLGGVAPAGPGAVPVVASGWITHDTLWKVLPHQEGKIHLGGRGRGEEGRQSMRKTSWKFHCFKGFPSFPKRNINSNSEVCPSEIIKKFIFFRKKNLQNSLYRRVWRGGGAGTQY